MKLVIAGVVSGISDLIGGRYELRVCLNASHMSSVFQAWDRQQECFVVVKIAMNNPRFPNLVEYLKYEALALQRLNHPRIVRLLDFGDINDNVYFLVLEYLQCLHLHSHLSAKGCLSLDLSISTMIQVLEGLEVIHKAGLVHRDIKPENLMITSDGVKIIDFGVAKFISPSDQEIKSLSKPGETVGSIPYMSPEQACDKDGLDGRSDIFACGVVLYRILTGAFPFRKFEADGKTPKSIYWDPPLRQFSEVMPLVRIPKQVQDIVWKALEADPNLRFQTAEEMRAALLAAEPPSFEILLEKLERDIKDIGRVSQVSITTRPMKQR